MLFIYLYLISFVVNENYLHCHCIPMSSVIWHEFAAYSDSDTIVILHLSRLLISNVVASNPDLCLNLGFNPGLRDVRTAPT